MVIDTSAVITLLLAEPEATKFAETIATAATRRMSAASLLETAIVIETRHGLPGAEKLDRLIQAAQVRIESVTVEQVEVARIAYRMYGKGRHPAGLNFGDCFAYALAKVADEPLLFKGVDFSQTDIRSATAI